MCVHIYIFFFSSAHTHIHIFIHQCFECSGFPWKMMQREACQSFSLLRVFNENLFTQRVIPLKKKPEAPSYMTSHVFLIHENINTSCYWFWCVFASCDIITDVEMLTGVSVRVFSLSSNLISLFWSMPALSLLICLFHYTSPAVDLLAPQGDSPVAYRRPPFGLQVDVYQWKTKTFILRSVPETHDGQSTSCRSPEAE